MAKKKRLTKEWVEGRRDEVRKLAQLGITDDELESVLQVSESAIKKHFREELTDGRNNMRAALRRAQFEKAIQEKDTKMLIWLGKMYLGQREPKHEIEHTGNMKVEATYYGEVAAKEAKERHQDT